MKKTVLKIFDFDGTTYRSATPNESLWTSHTYKKLMDAPEIGGYGWWQNPITLAPDVTNDTLFIDYIVDEIKESMNDENTLTVLLTGRTVNYMSDIKRIVAWKNLEFDYYGLKPLTGEATFKFKSKFIADILSENPDIIKVELWDDRIKHIKKFVTLFNTLNIDAEIHHVDEVGYYMSVEDELRIVDTLIKSSKSAVIVKPIQYSGVFLDKESSYNLLNQFIDVIPVDWKLYGHHMTMLFGKNKNDVVENYLSEHSGEIVTLTVTHIGVSKDAIAVKVSSDAPIDNVIPHITLAVRNGANPVMSNRITEWKEIESPIVLNGIVDSVY